MSGRDSPAVRRIFPTAVPVRGAAGKRPLAAVGGAGSPLSRRLHLTMTQMPERWQNQHPNICDSDPFLEAVPIGAARILTENLSRQSAIAADWYSFLESGAPFQKKLPA